MGLVLLGFRWVFHTVFRFLILNRTRSLRSSLFRSIDSSGEMFCVAHQRKQSDQAKWRRRHKECFKKFWVQSRSKPRGVVDPRLQSAIARGITWVTRWMTGAPEPEVCFWAVCHPADLPAGSGLTTTVNGMCGGGHTMQHFLSLNKYICTSKYIGIYIWSKWRPMFCAQRDPGKCWQLFKELLCNLHNVIVMHDTENIVNGKMSWCCTDTTALTVLIDAGFFFPPFAHLFWTSFKFAY